MLYEWERDWPRMSYDTQHSVAFMVHLYYIYILIHRETIPITFNSRGIHASAVRISSFSTVTATLCIILRCH